MAIQGLQSLAAANQRAALQGLAQRLERMGGGAPGPGGGGSPLTFGREAPDRADAFAPRRLSPSGLSDLEHSQVIGVASAAPEVAPVGEAATGSAFGTGGDETSERRRLAPRHRRAVERFFSTEPR